MAPAPSPLAPARSRRQPRPSGDDRQLAILATAERLLEQRGLAEISIDDLARGAGISRPTFYFYFASKDAVLLALLDGVVEQAARAAGDSIEHLADDPPRRWREAIGRTLDVFRSHRAVMLACARAGATNPEVRAVWSGVMQRWVAATASAIEAERRRGVAPPGLPARELAIALNAMNERVLYATFSGDEPAIGAERVVDVLLGVWLTTIYGTPYA